MEFKEFVAFGVREVRKGGRVAGILLLLPTCMWAHTHMHFPAKIKRKKEKLLQIQSIIFIDANFKTEWPINSYCNLANIG